MFRTNAKKPLAFLLTFVMLLSLLPVGVTAADDPIYAITNSGGTTDGTNVTVGKTIAEAVGAPSDGVYYDVTLTASDTYGSTEVFDDGDYLLYKGNSESSPGISLYTSEADAQAAIPGDDLVYSITVNFRFVGGSDYSLTLWVASADDNYITGQCFILFSYQSNGVLTSDKDKVYISQSDTHGVFDFDVPADSFYSHSYFGAMALSVADTVPAGFTFVSFLSNGDQATQSGGSILWTIPTHTAGGSFSLVYRIKMTTTDAGTHSLGSATLSYNDYGTGAPLLATLDSPAPSVGITYPAPLTYTVTATIDHGTVNGYGVFNSGASTTVTYDAAPGYYITSVTVDDGLPATNTDESVVSGSYAFSNITANHSVVVTTALKHYTVSYQFSTSAPSGAVLPAAASYESGALVTIAAGYDNVTDGGGTWHFNGWDRTQSFNLYENTTITGTWTYTPKPDFYAVTYQFSGSAPSGAALPAAASYESGTLVTIAAGYANITTSSGVWSFQGWDKTEPFHISADTVITGTWSYSPYRHTTYYSVKYQFTGDHPDGAALPASASYESGTLVHIAGGYDAVTGDGGTWTFDGWDKTEDFTIRADTLITGTWTFTPDAEIPEEEPPLGLPPVEEEPPVEAPPVEEPPVVIEEEEPPLGNLPQTGTTADAVKPAWETLGLLVLSFSTAAAGLTILFRRKDEAEH